MSNLIAPYSGFLAAAAGVASHLFYFNVGDHHMLALFYLQLFTLACAGSTTVLSYIAEITLTSALSTVLTLASCWLAGVYGSLITYRLFFHPLNKFPGPWQAKVGDLLMCFQLKKLDAYRVFDELHKKHGQYVRVGSNTLSITDARIMPLAYGPRSTVTKGDWYDGAEPHTSMHTTRDKPLHDRRRRVWAPAFSDKALREYETTVSGMNDKLVQEINKLTGKPVNMTTWFNLYSFDVMGRLAFGKDYGMVESGKRHWALDILSEGMELTGLRFPTWFSRVLLAIPGAAVGYYKFLDFCSGELASRVRDGTKESKDITGWLLKAYTSDKHPEKDPLLQGDTRLIIVAGSDTTAATLTYLFYHLALDQDQQRRLREELQPLATGDWSDKHVQHADHLNGAINETLRLHPPVPSGLMRRIPREGLQVGEVFIPGDVEFFTPQYPMARDDRIYPDAESWIPERWYKKPELVRSPDAFAPFSQGPFNCIGRNLALMELRTLTAQLLLKFDVSLAEGENGDRLLNKTKDHFTLTLGPLDLVFAPRSG